MVALVIPAILAQSAKEFRAKLTIAERLAPLVHIDVMDGRFVPNRAWANPRVIARMRTRARFEVHCMVREPARVVAAWGRVPRVERIIVHAEATHDLLQVLATIRAMGKEAGLAVNPSTPLARVHPFLRDVDAVLVMANEPGFSGKPFRPATLTRIRALRRTYPRLPIGADIGVNATTAPLLRHAGATHIAAASAIFGAPDPAAAYRDIRRAFLQPPRARS